MVPKHTVVPWTYFSTAITYHSHFGEVDKSFLCVVWCAFLNEGEISQVHAQIWNARRITSEINKIFV